MYRLAFVALTLTLTLPLAVVAVTGCVDAISEGPRGEGEGEGSLGEGEGEGAVGEGEGATGEGEGSVGEGEGEGSPGEGEGALGEGEGEGEGEGANAIAPTLDDALAALRNGNPDEVLLAFSKDNGLPLVLDDGTRLFATTGSLREFAGDVNGFQPEPMNDEGAFAWIMKNAPDAGGYKFSDGNAFAADPLSRAYTYDNFGEMSLTSRKPEGITGGRERHLDVSGFGLASRTVRVLLPPGPITHVMYAHDGQNLWDAPLSFSGQTWELDQALPAGVLVVGIDNTADRVFEYTPVFDDAEGAGGGSPEYDQLLEQVVRPLTRRWYGEPGPVGVMGSSLGGLVSFDIAERNPGAFAFAASLSGTFGWGSFGTDHDDTIIDRYTGAPHRSTVMYLDSGGTANGCADLDGDGINDDVDAGDNSCETVQMRDVLQADGYVNGTDLFYVIQENAQHNEAAWAGRVGNVLNIFASLP